MASIAHRIRWHRRMETRVAAGILLIVGLSLAAVIVTAARIATHSAMDRAAASLQDARSAFDRLVETRADFAAAQTRLIVALPVFRSIMLNPVVAADRATLSQAADSYRSDLGAEFSILTDPFRRTHGAARLAGRRGAAGPAADRHRGRRARGIAPRPGAHCRPPVPGHRRAGEVRRRGAGHGHLRLRARRSRGAPARRGHAHRNQPGVRPHTGRQQPCRRRARDHGLRD